MKEDQNQVQTDRMTAGYARILVSRGKDGKVTGYSVKKMNDRFGELTGLTFGDKNKLRSDGSIQGSDLLTPDVVYQIEDVLKTGNLLRTEKYSMTSGRRYSLEIVPEENESIFILVTDITETSTNSVDCEEILNLSRALLDYKFDTFDFDKLTCEICRISGAEYGVFNLYSNDRKKFRNYAIYGNSSFIQTVYKLLGFSIKNKEWDVSLPRLKEIRQGHILRFSNIAELSEGIIPGKICGAISKALNVKSVYVVEISAHENIIGDFIIFFKTGTEITNRSAVAAFANMVGVAISRKKDEERIIESENNLKNFFNAGIDFHWVLDSTGNIIEVNETVRNVLGYSDDELAGKSVLSVHPADRRDEALKIIQAMLKGEATVCRIPLLSKKGKLIPVETFVKSGLWNGAPALFGISRDISLLSRSEESLRESESKYRILTERMSDILWTTDLQFNATWVSPSVERVLGYTVEERLNHPPNEVFPPHSLEQAIQILASELLNDKESDPDRTITLKFDYYHKDGSIRVLENSMSFIRNSEGTPVGIHGLSRDITERQKAEEELLGAKEQLERAGYMAKIGTWEVDFVTGTTYWSDVARKIMSVPEDYKLTLEDVVAHYKAGENRERILELVERSRKSGEPIDDEFVIIGFDGREHWIRNIIHPIIADNNCVRMVGTSQDITEKKLAENLLKESEQNYKYLQGLFRNMADIIPDMMWAKDTQGKYLFANNSVCRNLLGAMDTQEPIGRNDLFFASRSRNSNPSVSDWHTFGQNCLNSDNIVLKSGKTGQFDEYGNVRGKFLYLDVIKSPLRDDNGKIIGTVGTARDITEKQRNENKLRESEANLKAIIENTLENIWSVNTSYEIQYVNEVFTKAFLGVFGIELKIGMNIVEALPEYLRPLWKERYDRAFKNEHFLFEDKIEAGGMTICIEVAMNPIIVDEKVVGAALYGRDVTDKVRAQMLINYQSELRKMLVELSSSFINLPLTELEPAIYKSLESIGQFVGADRAYVFRYDFDKGTATNTIEWCREGISRQIDKLQDIPFEDFRVWVEYHRKGKTVSVSSVDNVGDNSLKDLMISQEIKSLLTIPLIMQDECRGFVGFDSVRDFHEFTENENQLLHVYAQMLMNVQDRIEKENVLVMAKEKAEESERLKSAFLANMSHEIRTPMNGILGFLDLMRSPELSEENRSSYSKIVIHSGNRLLSTLNDIIEISKIETTEMKVNLSMVNISDMMKYFQGFFLPQAEEKGLKLILSGSLEGDAAMVLTDKSKIESMISNLLKNAIKFTMKGKIEFGNSLKGNMLIFKVKDTGPGISNEMKELIFKRFVQGDMSSTRHYEGAGLGLSIVRAFAELLKGKAWVESEPGKGSIFYFSVPYTPETSPVSQNKENGKQNGVIKSGITVLVVEDDPAGYLYLEKVLQSEKIKVLHTDTGPDTVKTVWENNTIDLILMDIKIPGFSGIEATREIRKFNTVVPIIAQTAYAFPTDREAAVEAGCNDYITKPVDKAELLKLIKKYTGSES